MDVAGAETQSRSNGMTSGGTAGFMRRLIRSHLRGFADELTITTATPWFGWFESLFDAKDHAAHRPDDDVRTEWFVPP